MAWYDKLREQGIIIRGTVNEQENDWYRKYTPKWEKDEDGEILKDKKGNNIQQKDKNGELVFNKEFNRKDAIEDVYIQCGSARKGDVIYCYTASIPNISNHTYLACIYSYGRGMNTLRDFYSKYIGEHTDIYRMIKSTKIETTVKNGKKEKKKVEILDEDGNIKMEREWLDEKLLKAINKDERLFDIEICDEVYFKCNDMEILKDIMDIKILKSKKKSKKSKDPFDTSYLNWDKYKIPQNDLDKFKEIKDNKFGEYEFGSPEAIIAMRKIKTTIDKFISKNNIDLDVKRRIRVEGNQEAIHALGLWSEFMLCFK